MRDSKPCTVHLTNQIIEYYPLPSCSQQGLQAIVQQIQQAKTSICVAMFSISHPKILLALNDAAQRGVKVTLITDHKYADLLFKKLKHHHFYDCNIRVVKSTNSLHHKFAVIDHRTLIFGSVNWSKNGFHGNIEDLLLLHNLSPRQEKKLQAIWKQLYALSKPIEAAQLYAHQHQAA